jgi:predicted nucleotidyltransferase component of viral defense system
MMNEDALKAKIQMAAQSMGLLFNEVFHRLVMERFLARVSLSPQCSSFIFKGGFLLSRYLDLGRDTRDLDFLAIRIEAERSNIESHLREISSTRVEDGFNFELKSISELKHTHMNYPGFSASFLVSFGKLKEHLEIDIGFGDVVGQVRLPVKLMRGLGRAIFEDEISLFVYPAGSILAEKLQTVVFRADKNSRMKDYYDIFRLLNSSVLSKEKVTSAIRVTFEHRQTNIGLLPLRFSEAEFDQLQKYWSAFHRGLRSKEDIPKQICAVVDFINLELKKLGLG